ncbi:MAG: glycosyltransferase [Clostridiales bacterium]|nr:glycosyltransferase [Clostridiales bacterium]
MSVISVIVPAYNTDRFIRSCIESVLANQDAQLILVDDGSTDNTLSIMKEYEDRGNVRIISIDHSGLGKARNTGVLQADGDYIWFVDSDDVIERDSVQKLISKSEETDADVIFTDIVPFADTPSMENKLSHYRKLYKRKKRYDGVRTGLEMMEGFVSGNDYYPTTCRYILKREFIREKDIKVMESVAHEDNSYTFEVLLKARKTAYVMEPLYRRRLREGSIVTAPLSFERIRGYLLNIMKMREDAASVLGTDDLPSYVSEVIGKSIRSMYIAYRKLSEEEKARISELAPEERRAFFDVMEPIKESERIIRALNSEKADLREENKKLKKDREEITSSLSYKIGRVITFIPRKIRGLLKK